MRALQVIILAAGSGTRMKSELPKVLHPICGRPMIAHALDLAAASGVRQPIVVIGDHAEEIKAVLPNEAKVVIQKSPLGTGDAVMAAKRIITGFSGDVLILYADTPLLRRTTVQRLIEAHYKSNATCTLLTAHLADPTGYGRIVRDATGVITGLVEEAEAHAAQRSIREINVGPVCIKAQPLFEALDAVQPSSVKKEWYLTQAITILGQRPGTKFQTARVEEITEAFGVNSRADLARSIGIVKQRLIDAHLQNGVTIIDPPSTFIEYGVTIGQDTTIYPGTYIESGVTIGKRCSVGPHARLRAGTAIGDGTRVGNFVELVRTKVGDGVRINHVSYLGDATIEDHVNIGAGTITANFDGVNKQQTVIGKDAFIGCDTILIAPVKVGQGAVTGAGSVVTRQHDVAPKTVVSGVPARLMPNARPKPVAQALSSDGRGAKAKAPAAKAKVALPSKPARNGKANPARVKVAAKRRPAVVRKKTVVRRPAAKPKPSKAKSNAKHGR